MESLVTLIARQSGLKLLNLAYNGFTEEQEQRVRSAVTNSACRVIITDEEYEAYEAEQEEAGASYDEEYEEEDEEQEEAEEAASATQAQ